MKYILLFILRTYKIFISPVSQVIFGNACRFTPSCSQYTIEALERYGALKGIALGLKRFLRCHPWGGSGHDPVPDKINSKQYGRNF